MAAWTKLARVGVSWLELSGARVGQEWTLAQNLEKSKWGKSLGEVKPQIWNLD